MSVYFAFEVNKLARYNLYGAMFSRRLEFERCDWLIVALETRLGPG